MAIFVDCPFRDPECMVDLRCMGCAYEHLIMNSLPIRPALWHGYVHPRSIKAPVPPVEAIEAPEAPIQPTPGNSLRRLASGTIVEVNPQGRVVKKHEQHEI